MATPPLCIGSELGRTEPEQPFFTRVACNFSFSWFSHCFALEEAKLVRFVLNFNNPITKAPPPKMLSTPPKAAEENRAERAMQMGRTRPSQKEQEGASESTASTSRAFLEPSLGKTLDNANGAWR